MIVCLCNESSDTLYEYMYKDQYYGLSCYHDVVVRQDVKSINDELLCLLYYVGHIARNVNNDLSHGLDLI